MFDGRVDLFAADGGDQVEVDEVAGLGGAVDRDEGAEAGAQVLQLVLHLIRGHRHRVDLELQRVVLGQREVGAHVDLDGELQVAGEVLLVRPLGDVGLGAAERAQLLVVGGLAVELVEAVADGVVEHLGAADALVDDGRRHLALAEAGDVHRLGDVLVGVVDARLELFGGDGDAELHARGLSFSTVVLTMGSYSWMWLVVCAVGATGFEPATSRSQSGHSTKLSYAPRSAEKGLAQSSGVCCEECRCACSHCWHGRHRDPGGARVRGALPRVR